ncbi:MAG: hypothetical protein PHG47_06815 [Sulfuricella sp.]|nr:hypothetical protein [Sulfuricella sp.]
MTETDSHGVVTETLDIGAKSTLRGKRRRFFPGKPVPLDSLPAAWRDLLTRWVRRGERCKGETLFKDAGPKGVETARALLDWLLRSGWTSQTEKREHGRWQLKWLDFSDLGRLRSGLGLADTEALARNWQAARQGEFSDPLLQQAANELDSRPPALALARHALLVAVAAWREEIRYGTRRDFALFARGDTKAITAGEWDWLTATLPLPDYGIERHAPLLLLRAPLILETPEGRISLGAAPDFIALSAETVAAATVLEGHIDVWRLVENRTSFERTAREYGLRDGVIWLPGFAPSWWKKAMLQLLKFQPMPALVACDPDPAGIEIALDAGSVWKNAGLSWQPWHMDIPFISALPRRKSLTERDRQRLAVLGSGNLPEDLAVLASWMEAHGEKGEQEGLL